MRKRHPALIALVLAFAVLVTALVVASCGGGAATTTTAAAPTTTGTPNTTGAPGTTGVTAGAADGVALYTANCARCHDSVPGGSSQQVEAVVLSGKESMPGFKDTLTAEQIAAIVSFVTSGGK
jgi:mono/diheme cytochrome c family protein